ncbi:hypothetical protein CWI39_0786p0020 [Hamiltosporidium magnivora]|uniref:Uncharacterized protein n=1 Tax=Hamiltosporidium magnivora TaxID=148818 RepID=A0A4Q9L9Z2_9MICR|nr:hypothetical protein CWI39_0786p0020 [Hamiltosporidium magnivora]
MKIKQKELEKSLLKANKVFRRSIDQRIYGREHETRKIKEFIETGSGILNICGNPGSGKTFCVLKVLKNTNFLYVNCLVEENVIEEINKYKGLMVVIDEFDKFYMNKKGVCVGLLNKLKERMCKVITISNYLLFCDCSVVFKPYSYEDFVFILSKKIEDEIGEEIVEKGVVEVISRKHSHHGDIRKAFEFILKLINKKSKEVECHVINKKGRTCKSKKFNLIHKNKISSKINKKNTVNVDNKINTVNVENKKNNEIYIENEITTNNKINTESEITKNNKYNIENKINKENNIQDKYLNGESSLISICDVMESENKNEEIESNIHKEIIKELIENNYGCSKIEIYKKYLIKCNSLNITFVDRNDFGLIYELLSN